MPIQHTRRVVGAHARYDGFSDFGDGKSDRSHQPGIRTALGMELSDEDTDREGQNGKGAK